MVPRFRDGIAVAVPGLRTPFFTYYVLSCRVEMSASVLGFRPLDPIPPRTVLMLRLRSSLCVRWPTAVLGYPPPYLDSERRSPGTVVSTAGPGRRRRVVISAAVLGFRQLDSTPPRTVLVLGLCSSPVTLCSVAGRRAKILPRRIWTRRAAL